jgi:hypothetical protein
MSLIHTARGKIRVDLEWEILKQKGHEVYKGNSYLFLRDTERFHENHLRRSNA